MTWDPWNPLTRGPVAQSTLDRIEEGFQIVASRVSRGWCEEIGRTEDEALAIAKSAFVSSFRAQSPSLVLYEIQKFDLRPTAAERGSR